MFLLKLYIYIFVSGDTPLLRPTSPYTLLLLKEQAHYDTRAVLHIGRNPSVSSLTLAARKIAGI
jgi:hypothetical protein